MTFQKSLDCEKCGGLASLLCTACNLCACLDCITLVHKVPSFNPLSSQSFIRKDINGGTNHSTLPCPKPAG